MKYKNIIWDWNGTLLDDIDLCISIFRTLSQRFEMRAVTREEYRNNFDFPVSDFYVKYGFNPDKFSFEEVSKVFAKNFAEGRKSCELQEGARDSLSAIFESGSSQSVLSAYESNALNESVRENHIDNFFEKVSGLKDNMAASKIELGKVHMASLGLNPSETIIIGDTLHDARVADALHIDCALLSCGHHSRARLLRTGRPVFEKHKELLDWLF